MNSCSNVLLITCSLGIIFSCSDNNSVNSSSIDSQQTTSLIERPLSLAMQLEDSALKNKLLNCETSGILTSPLTISHRGAPREVPEHTREGYNLAAKQGAATIECDVTFTKDKELVCRHSQCDLHTTTNILTTPLAQQCQVPPDNTSDTPYANAKCCTSDITLAEFKTLRGKRDGGNKNAKDIDTYLAATPGWSSNSDANYGELLSHKDSIALFDSLGVSMIPELKAPQVSMPFDGDYSQTEYASQMINEYIDAGIDSKRVSPQSFNLQDINHWNQTSPDFGSNAVYLDGRYRDTAFDINDITSWSPTMDELVAQGIQTLASPVWMLVTLDDWYYQSVQASISNEGDVFRVIDTLVNDVGVTGIFSDWPITTAYFEACSN